MSNPITIRPTTPKQAVLRARQMILDERSGEQLGLFTRFNALNISVRKYFRFANINLIAGLSGHGKSYLLNLITEDFLDYGVNGINSNIKFIPIVLHFNFEMSSEVEVLRSCASDLGLNFNYLLSSYYDKETKTYNTLTDEELIKVDNYLKYYASKSILFFEYGGNIKVIYETVAKYANYYNNLAKAFNTEHATRINKGEILAREYKFIVNIDHTLLIERLGESDALELMTNVGKFAVRVQKEFKCMVNMLGQLNNKIEETDRIMKPSLHFPQKSDIYAQSQLYNACDDVFVIHQPSLLKIPLYGLKKHPTKNLIHLLRLKARNGEPGSVWLRNDLRNGTIVPYETVTEDEIDDPTILSL